MITNVYLVLILLTFSPLASASVSTLNCSSFSSDKDIIRSLPVRVLINPSPSSFPTFYNYAVVSSQGRVIELTLTGLKNVVPLPVFCLKGLQSLTVQYSTNLTLPSEVSRLASSLTSLSLVGVSQYLTLPSDLFNITSLKNLSIIASGLVVLPEAIGQLYLLSNLTLTGNQLRSLPASLGKMMSLRWLTVDNNVPLSSLDVLNGYKGLLGLSASNCAIDHLPTNLSTLTTIDMSRNKLTSLADLDSLTWFTCTSLVFSNNSITTIPTTIGKLQSLNNLDLSNNLLTELPTWVYNINLTTINVRNNKFDDKEAEWIRGLFQPTKTAVYV